MALKNDSLISIPESTVCLAEGVINISAYSNIGVAGNANFTLQCSKVQRSGIYLADITNLWLSNMTLAGCGALFDSASGNISNSMHSTYKLPVAVYVINVTNMTMHSVNIHSTRGMGLAVYDTSGEIFLSDCVFTNNTVPANQRDIYPGGGGMLLQYTYCTPGLTSCNPLTNVHNSKSRVVVQGCVFESNQASTVPQVVDFVMDKGTRTQTFGTGGGLCIAFGGHSMNNTVILQDVVFSSNLAPFGGAASIQFTDYATGNNCTLQGAQIVDNRALQDGGGLRIGLEFYNCSECVHGNLLHINGHFLSNKAEWGGAVEFFSSYMKSSEHTNTIHFESCTFDSNSAKLAAAVDVVPDAFDTLLFGYLPVPVFENCTFVRNTLLSTQSGILNINAIEVQFVSFALFENNTGTAVYASDGILNILSDTYVQYTSNTGIQGGAVALIGSSAIRTYPGANLIFYNNSASELGGAIYYYSATPSLFFYSYSCFLQYWDQMVLPDKWQVKFNFTNNTAGEYGHSIYATTILPCARAAANRSTPSHEIPYVFNSAPFSYFDPYKKYNIATYPDRLAFANASQSRVLTAAPGQVFSMGIQAYDELNQTAKTVFHAEIVQNSSNAASIDPDYTYISDGEMRIKGPQGYSFQLNLQTIGPRRNTKLIDMTLTYCPPGYVLTPNTSECTCSANTKDHRYNGIYRCDSEKFQAVLNEGYWAGCTNGSLDTFATGECPLGFCGAQTNVSILLPQTCEGVETLLCGSKHRRGLLCGRCKDNRTVYYHSSRYLCGECRYPQLGWLFYILSELVPLTLIFVVIIIFGISFTSGPANSFILFAQVLDFFDVTSLGTFQLPGALVYITGIYQIIFGALNLDFFKLDVLSFCLWKDATVLDIFVFKYITTAFALFLVVVLIVALRFIPACYSCLQRFVFKHSVRDSLIQGISALLIMSYAQCAKVSFQILTAGTLYNNNGLKPVKKVVFLSGETPFFGSEHLPYAVPAMLVLLLTLIPPCMLIAYPAVTKLFSRCSCRISNKLDESRDNIHFYSVWFSRLKPFFDSFQSCFKDNCRYFAGLYFVYRLAFSIAFAFTDNAVEFYLCLEIIIIAMLVIHSIIQPYEIRFYNMIDAAIFADLAVINGLSIYDYYLAQYSSVTGDTLTATSAIQAALIYLPLTYITTVTLLKAAVRFKRVRAIWWIRRMNQHIPLFSEHQNYNLEHSLNFNENHLPYRLFEENTVPSPRHRRASYGATGRVTM